MVCRLAYLAICTRPCLKIAVSSLARHLHEPTPRHLALFNIVLLYLVGTLSYGLLFRVENPMIPISFCAAVYADWVGCKSTRCSTSSYIIPVIFTTMFCGSLNDKPWSLCHLLMLSTSLFPACVRIDSLLRLTLGKKLHQKP